MNAAPVPHAAVEAERGVLGSILLDAARVMPLCEHAGIVPESFAIEQHRQVFRAFADLHRTGAPVDLVSAVDRLRAAGRLEEIGGPLFLESLVDATPTTAHAEYYIAKVCTAADLRRLAVWHRKAGETISRGDTAAAMLASELSAQLDTFRPNASARIDDASTVLASPHETPSMLVAGIYGPGDIFQLNGSSKGRKTFLMKQLALCIATGRPFLGFEIAMPSPVIFANLELRPVFFRERLRRMAAALGIKKTAAIFRIIHGRGQEPSDVLADVKSMARRIKAGAIFLDPIYCLAPTGDENNSRDAKEIAATLAGLAEMTEAAVVYSHHTGKGTPGDRAAVDRGAGSGVLARAFDASLSILPHASEPDAFVVELVLRNFAPREPFAVRWQDDCFVLSPDLSPEAETARTRQAKSFTRRPQHNAVDLQKAAQRIVEAKALPANVFDSRLQKAMGAGEKAARVARADLIEGGTLSISRREPRPGGACYVGTPEQIETLHHSWQSDED